MKRTNVMIEISDEVYEKVVLPYKAKKQFGKLMCMLLEAYATNDSIYSYINGAIDDIEDEAANELLKDLNYMSQSLSMFGALGQQAETVIYNGQKAFNEFGMKASDELDSGFNPSLGGTGKPYSKREDENSKGGEANKPLTREDVVSIVNESVSDIKDMLKSLISGGAVHPIAEPESEVESGSSHEHEEVAINSDEVALGKVEVAVEPISAEEEEVAQEALSSLLGSITF